MLSHEVRKVNKFSHTELFGAARQQGLSQKLCMIRSSPFAALVEFGQQRLDRATQHFTSLIESGVHHAAQQILVAAGVFTSLRVMRTTALRTLGGGLNTPGSTVNK